MTREQVQAMSDTDALALLNLVESVKGWPCRVLTREDAGNYVEGFGEEPMNDEEYRRVFEIAESHELGCVSAEDWETFGFCVRQVVDARPACPDCGDRRRADFEKCPACRAEAVAL